MEKFKQILKMKIEDETAAFAILGAMIITFSITIIAFETISYNKTTTVTNNDVATSKVEITADTVSKLDEINEIEEEAILDEEQTEPENEEEVEKLEQESKTSSSTSEYYIKINYGAQVVTVYTKDSDGKYTKPVKAMICSTGTSTPTSGVYTIGYKWEWLKLIGNVWGHYVTQIYGDILFHSVPYLTKGDKSSLEYWEYDKLGTKASLGCIRLTVKDALWIYNNISSGTKVEFYSSSNPGPLGKPTAMKISSAPSSVRGWDPTDPDKNNPWPKYLEGLEQEEKNENQNSNTTNSDKTNQTNTTGNNVTNTTNNETVENTIENNITNTVDNTTNDETTDVVENDTNTDNDNSEVDKNNSE